jgi:hypothetical protein
MQLGSGVQLGGSVAVPSVHCWPHIAGDGVDDSVQPPVQEARLLSYNTQ